MKKSSKPGLGDKFQLAIVGDYPTRSVRLSGPPSPLGFSPSVLSSFVAFFSPRTPLHPPPTHTKPHTQSLPSIPHSIRPLQTVKLTFDVVAEQASFLMVNVLSKNVREKTEEVMGYVRHMHMCICVYVMYQFTHPTLP